MEKETRMLIKEAKKRINDKSIKEIMKIKNESERKDALGKSIVIALNEDVKKIEENIWRLEKANKDVFAQKMKIIMLIKKIHYFKASYDRKELHKLELLFDKMKKEVKDV